MNEMANREFLDNMKKDERAIDNNNSLPPLSALLDHIEKGCQQINEERNFVDYLLSMEKETSLDELIHKFNNIFKLLCNINYKGRKTPKNWYLYKSWTNRIYVDSLLCYLNENILSLFKRHGDYSKKEYVSYIINLRICENTKTIEKEILKIANKKYNSKLYKLITDRYEIDKIRRGFCFDDDTFSVYYTSPVFYGYILDEIDNQIGLKYGYNQEKLKEQYLHLKKENIIKNIKGISIIILAFIVLAPIFYLLSKIGPFGLIIIIGLLGLAPKILLSGKI